MIRAAIVVWVIKHPSYQHGQLLWIVWVFPKPSPSCNMAAKEVESYLDLPHWFPFGDCNRTVFVTQHLQQIRKNYGGRIRHPPLRMDATQLACKCMTSSKTALASASMPPQMALDWVDILNGVMECKRVARRFKKVNRRAVQMYRYLMVPEGPGAEMNMLTLTYYVPNTWSSQGLQGNGIQTEHPSRLLILVEQQSPSSLFVVAAGGFSVVYSVRGL